MVSYEAELRLRFHSLISGGGAKSGGRLRGRRQQRLEHGTIVEHGERLACIEIADRLLKCLGILNFGARDGEMSIDAPAGARWLFYRKRARCTVLGRITSWSAVLGPFQHRRVEPFGETSCRPARLDHGLRHAYLGPARGGQVQ
jgi:hypothetical protein